MFREIRSLVAIRARSPFDALATLACPGQALGPRLRRPLLKPGVYLKAWAFGMTPSTLDIDGGHATIE